MKPAALSILIACGAAGAKDHPIPYPHPVITEILYEVPSEALGGDANLDGAQSYLGDEFVEFLNPHSETIDLSGYSFGDTYADARWSFTFTFPEGALLEPGQRAVVFNGFRQTKQMPEPSGDLRTVSNEPNASFGGAVVYSLKNISSARAFTDDGDICALRDPEGNVIELIVWGTPKGPVPEDAMRRQTLPVDVAFSFQRLGAWGPLMSHLDIDGRRFSPGEVPTEMTGPNATPNADAPSDEND